MSQSQKQMQAAQDPDFATVPPGCIPARNGVRRDDHAIHAARIYRGPHMQQQRRGQHPDNIAQQMAMAPQI